MKEIRIHINALLTLAHNVLKETNFYQNLYSYNFKEE